MGRFTRNAGFAGTAIAVMALVAHVWMFTSHEPMAAHADAARTAASAASAANAAASAASAASAAASAASAASAAASVTDAPLPASACSAGMSACTVALVEEPRLPSAAVLSPLAAVLLAVRDRRVGARSRARASGARLAPSLSPVTAGVLLLE